MLGKLLRSILRNSGYDLRRDLNIFLAHNDARIPVTPTMTLAYISIQLPQVRVLQLGANDGKTHDFLNPFLNDPKWSGLLVEGDPQIFSSLQVNNQNRIGRIQTLNLFVGDHKNQAFYSINTIRRKELGLPDWVDGIGGMAEGPIQQHCRALPEIAKCVVRQDVTCEDVNSIINRYFDKGLDVIVTDIEGMDTEIIESLDMDANRPLAYIFESCHSTQKQLNTVFEKFYAHGYRVHWGGQDSVAIRSSFLT